MPQSFNNNLAFNSLRGAIYFLILTLDDQMHNNTRKQIVNCLVVTKWAFAKRASKFPPLNPSTFVTGNTSDPAG